MIFFSQYIYFLSACIFSLLWLLFFTLNKKEDCQKMVYISLSTLVLGFFVQQMHLTDWWQPHFIFNSVIKIEDVLFGFSSGGVISGIYCLLRKHIRLQDTRMFPKLYKILLIVLSLFILFGFFYIFHVHSFLTSVFALLIPILVVCFWRPRILPIIILTGVIITTIAFLGYRFSIYINPAYVSETYLFDYLSGKLFFGIPVEELWWFLFAGLGVASAQEVIWSKK